MVATMAAQPNPAAPAAADATTTAGSGESSASTTQQTARPSLLSLPSTAAFDVEDLPDGEMNATAPESKTEDPTNDATDATEQTEDTSATDEAGDIPDEHDEEPEVVEDQDGKRLVSAKHLERALKQRATAKTSEREALARAEAAEKQASDLKTQLEATLVKPVTGTEQALMRFLPDDSKFNPNDEQALAQLETHAKKWIDWCEENPMGGEPNEGEDWDTKQVVRQKREMQKILQAVRDHRDFQTKLTTERAKVQTANPKLFQVGTEEQKAHATARKELLGLASAPNQDAIIAELVNYRTMKQREAAEGGSWVFVPKKASNKSEATATERPKARTVQVTTRPIGSVRANAETGSRKTMADKLAEGAQDVEALFDAA